MTQAWFVLNETTDSGGTTRPDFHGVDVDRWGGVSRVGGSPRFVVRVEAPQSKINALRAALTPAEEAISGTPVVMLNSATGKSLSDAEWNGRIL